MTTDVRPFNFTGGEPHECGADGDAAATVIAAAPITIAGTWNDGFGSPTFDTVAGEDVALRHGNGALPGRVQERRGARTSGSCDVAVANGDRVLFAYSPRSATRCWPLSGPASVEDRRDGRR